MMWTGRRSRQRTFVLIVMLSGLALSVSAEPAAADDAPDRVEPGSGLSSTQPSGIDGVSAPSPSSPPDLPPTAEDDPPLDQTQDGATAGAESHQTTPNSQETPSQTLAEATSATKPPEVGMGEPDMSWLGSIPLRPGPRRFGGWFQPWVVLVILGLPTLYLIVLRRRDIRRFFDSRSWRRKVKEEPPP